MERDLFICVDGHAARQHAGRDGSRLIDPDVPDLWLAFFGQDAHIGIEAKILERHSISVRQSQLKAWRTNGKGAYRPKLWVASNRDLTEFVCWKHVALLPKLDSTASTVDNVVLSVSQYPPAHRSKTIAELALYILAN
jgi:hypothetical protein